MSKLPEIEKGKCPRCDMDIVANIPFIDHGITGYKSEDHGCGENVTLVVFKVTADDLFGE